MKDLELIENGNNLIIRNFDLGIAESSVYIANKIRIIMKTFNGEWYLNLNAGLPYYSDILVKSPNLDFIADIYTSAILGVSGVESIDEFELTLDGRLLEITFIAILTNGDSITITETI